MQSFISLHCLNIQPGLKGVLSWKLPSSYTHSFKPFTAWHICQSQLKSSLLLHTNIHQQFSSFRLDQKVTLLEEFPLTTVAISLVGGHTTINQLPQSTQQKVLSSLPISLQNPQSSTYVHMNTKSFQLCLLHHEVDKQNPPLLQMWSAMFLYVALTREELKKIAVTYTRSMSLSTYLISISYLSIFIYLLLYILYLSLSIFYLSISYLSIYLSPIYLSVCYSAVVLLYLDIKECLMATISSRKGEFTDQGFTSIK